MAWAAIALPRCGGIAMESSCVPKRMMSKKRSTGDDPKPKPNGHDAVSRQFLMSSVPTGRPYVSPGQRPGRRNMINYKSPKGAAITMNATSTNPKPRPCCNAKMNDHKNEFIRHRPPRWGFVKSGRSETQAVGLGCHSVATLWRNRIGIILKNQKTKNQKGKNQKGTFYLSSKAQCPLSMH